MQLIALTAVIAAAGALLPILLGRGGAVPVPARVKRRR